MIGSLFHYRQYERLSAVKGWPIQVRYGWRYRMSADIDDRLISITLDNLKSTWGLITGV